MWGRRGRGKRKDDMLPADEHQNESFFHTDEPICKAEIQTQRHREQMYG